MLNRRLSLTLGVVAACLIGAGQFAVAKNSNHHSGHAMLGEKLHKDGKHEVHKKGKNSVVAEVKNHKVVNMAAGDLPVRKVKTNKKMVSLDGPRLAANGDFKIAQNDISYGYCFDDGVTEDCYWYTADDVLVGESIWYDYAA